jgi:hypothetical protein
MDRNMDRVCVALLMIVCVGGCGGRATTSDTVQPGDGGGQVDSHVALDASDASLDASTSPDTSWDAETSQDVLQETNVDDGAAPCVPLAGVDPRRLDECLAQNQGCACEPGCEDGFTTVVWFPEDQGPFPSDIFPSPELLNAAVARYDCSICDCHEGWSIAEDGVWTDVGVCQMCNHILTSDLQCGGCLVQWVGGCC